jgi:mannonate dehydratase
MKLGFGLYRHQLNREHYRFARQIGATHLVVHYVDYFNLGGNENDRGNQPTGGLGGWGRAGDPDRLWSIEELSALRQEIEAEGLTLHAIENFDPAHWFDVLLAGPQREPQLESLNKSSEMSERLGSLSLGIISASPVCMDGQRGRLPAAERSPLDCWVLWITRRSQTE